MRRMFGIGPLELFALAAVALVVIGPRRLPEVARQAGRFMAEIRRTTYDLRTTLDAELQAEDRDVRRSQAEERRRKFRESRDEAKASGEWPPGGGQDATKRPQPTVGELSAPPRSEPEAPASEDAAPASTESLASTDVPAGDPATAAPPPSPSPPSSVPSPSPAAAAPSGEPAGAGSAGAEEAPDPAEQDAAEATT